MTKLILNLFTKRGQKRHLILQGKLLEKFIKKLDLSLDKIYKIIDFKRFLWYLSYKKVGLIVNKLIIITTISLLGVGNLYNSDGAASIGIIGGTDGSTEIYTEKKEDNDKNEGIEITSGTDGLTEIYTDKE